LRWIFDFMPDLSALGWNADIAATFVRLAGQTPSAPEGAPASPAATPNQGGLIPGRVSLEHNHVYRVLTESGEWLAEVSGKLKFQATGAGELPAVGDWVGLRRAAEHDRATIRLILPRRSRFSRKAPGRGTEEQVVAANIDRVFLVSSLESDPKPRSIERYLVLTRQSGAQPVIVLNKADLAEDVNAVIAEVSALAPDVPVHAVSARDGRGLEWLDTYLVTGQTIALLGPSGAGKSSIVNRLVGHAMLDTGEVRSWDARGRHTSVHRQMIVLERGGVLIDTPGLRELQSWAPDESLDQVFGDIEALAPACRFRDCRHETEPGCAVKAAVADAQLDASRYESYRKLAAERAALEVLQSERDLIERKRQGKIAAKALRALHTKKGRP
jgi:ribosome biogenesis GTPase